MFVVYDSVRGVGGSGDVGEIERIKECSGGWVKWRKKMKWKTEMRVKVSKRVASIVDKTIGEKTGGMVWAYVTGRKRQGEDRDRNDWLRLCVIYENYWWACRTVVGDKSGRPPSRRECVGSRAKEKSSGLVNYSWTRGRGHAITITLFGCNYSASLSCIGRNWAQDNGTRHPFWV